MSFTSLNCLAVHGVGQPCHPHQFRHPGYPSVRGKHVVLPTTKTGHVVFEEPHHARVVDVPGIDGVNDEWLHVERGLKEESASDTAMVSGTRFRIITGYHSTSRMGRRDRDSHWVYQF